MAGGFSTTRMRITTPLVKFSSFFIETTCKLSHFFYTPDLDFCDLYLFSHPPTPTSRQTLFLSDNDFMQPVGDDAWHRKGWIPARFTTSGLTECESSVNSEADILNNNHNTLFVSIFDFAINLHSNSLLNALLIMYIKLQWICKFRVFIFKSKLKQSYF